MDPVTLATLTAAATTLSIEVAKGAASGAGGAAWSNVMKLFGWTEPPSEADTAKLIAERLQEAPELAAPLAELLKTAPGPASSLVGTINAEKVVVVSGHIDNINM